jgi:hypothetical protein
MVLMFAGWVNEVNNAGRGPTTESAILVKM